jgi:uridine kinase
MENQIKMSKPFLIGVSGGSASGKTSLCKAIHDSLGPEDCSMIPVDSFYKNLTSEELLNVSDYNFDHPNAFDFSELQQSLTGLLLNNEVEIPIYDYVNYSRTGKTLTIKPTKIVIIEGIMALYDKEVRSMFDLKIFVHTDDDERLARRIERDTRTRGRDVFSTISWYRKFVKPAFDDFIAPVMKYADIIIPRGVENKVALDLLISNLRARVG